ncbi:RNA binding methyltransferase FtsJ like [hydrothermal vent metagenome]|uniref:RNA binding methyltransferase FtsJ like n=1 Tax=hydrothermal vent metagenome TaxID=652676 RepID=A0A3B1CUG5_9ZZZZ
MKGTDSIAKAPKERLDRLVFLRGLAESRERARALILGGLVIVDGNKIDKAGTFFKSDVAIHLCGQTHPFVSRGGLKLEAALEAFDVDVKQAVVIDVGASTGGFTDCLLKRDAARVYALDVGYGQLAWSLRQDPRVVVLERQNVRSLLAESIPEEVDLVTIDVSFISLEKVIPAIFPWMKEGGGLIALVKPQFEVGKGEVGKGGIVRDLEKRKAVLERICGMGSQWGLKTLGSICSPIRGQKGNVEYLAYFRRLFS